MYGHPVAEPPPTSIWSPLDMTRRRATMTPPTGHSTLDGHLEGGGPAATTAGQPHE